MEEEGGGGGKTGDKEIYMCTRGQHPKSGMAMATWSGLHRSTIALRLGICSPYGVVLQQLFAKQTVFWFHGQRSVSPDVSQTEKNDVSTGRVTDLGPSFPTWELAELQHEAQGPSIKQCVDCSEHAAAFAFPLLPLSFRLGHGVTPLSDGGWEGVVHSVPFDPLLQTLPLRCHGDATMMAESSR